MHHGKIVFGKQKSTEHSKRMNDRKQAEKASIIQVSAMLAPPHLLCCEELQCADSWRARREGNAERCGHRAQQTEY